MKHKFLYAVLIAFALVCLNLAISKPMEAAGPPEGPSAQAPTENRAKVDITINDAGQISIGGINLGALGLAPLDPQIATYAKNIGSVSVQVQSQSVAVMAQNTEGMRVLWNPATRKALVDLAASYGVAIQPDVEARVEEWVSSSDLDLTARYSNEGSHALEIDLAKPILVDIADNGQLAIERGPLATGIDTTVLQQIRMGGNQAVACWKEGTLTAMVDGAELPTVIITPAGFDMITQAFNLPINSAGMSAIMNTRFGIDLSLPGGTHAAGASCAN